MAPQYASAEGRRLASWGRRAAALFLDTFYNLLAYSAMFLASAVVLDQSLSSGSNWANVLLATQLALSIGSLVFVLAYSIFPYARSFPQKGQSPGKRALAIQVQCLDGSPLKASAWFTRVLLSGFFTVITLGLYWVANVFWPLVDDNNQALHDKLAGTIVVDLREHNEFGVPLAPVPAGPVVASVAAGIAAVAIYIGAVAQFSGANLGLAYVGSNGGTVGANYNEYNLDDSFGSDSSDAGTSDLDSIPSTSDSYDSSSDSTESTADIGDASGDQLLTDTDKYEYATTSKSGRMEQTIREHFQDRLEGRYSAAYAKYTYPLTETAGSEAGWTQGVSEDGLQSVEFITLEVLSGDQVKVKFETNSIGDGCNRFRTTYQMANVAGNWRMADSINPTKWAC